MTVRVDGENQSKSVITFSLSLRLSNLSRLVECWFLRALSLVPVVALCLGVQTTAQEEGKVGISERCSLSGLQRQVARKLAWNEFDQTGTAEGSFRALTRKACFAEAISAYEEWLIHGPGYPDRRARSIGNFHQGQLFALLGERGRAVDLMRRAYRDRSKDDRSANTWNIYVQGTIGFLEGDPQTVASCYRKLKDRAEPFAKSQAGVLKRLIDCEECDYRTAMYHR